MYAGDRDVCTNLEGPNVVKTKLCSYRMTNADLLNISNMRDMLARRDGLLGRDPKRRSATDVIRLALVWGVDRLLGECEEAEKAQAEAEERMFGKKKMATARKSKRKVKNSA